MIQSICLDGFMFWMNIDVCSKLYSAPHPTHVFDLKIKVTDFDFLC